MFPFIVFIIILCT